MSSKTKLSLAVAMAVSVSAPLAFSAPTVSDADWRNLQVRHSSMCLDLAGGNMNNGASFHQWGCNKNNANQRFGFINRGNGFYSIKTKRSGKCLDVKGGSAKNGTDIQQWSCSSNSKNQQFSLVDAGNGYFKLKNRASGACLDVAGASTKQGDEIFQWACLGNHPNQEFRFIHDSGSSPSVPTNPTEPSNPSTPTGKSIKVEAEIYVDYGGTFDDGQASPISTYSVAGKGAINYVNKNDFIDYMVNASEAGMYEVNFNIATGVSANSAIELLVEDSGKWVSYATAVVPKTGWDNFTSLKGSGKVKLKAGEQKVRAHAMGSNDWQWNLESFTLTYVGDAPSDGSDDNGDSGNPGNQNPGDQTPSDISQIAKSGYSSQGYNSSAVQSLPVPAAAPSGQKWVEQKSQSDDFNYEFKATPYRSDFGPGNKWYNFYHNAWNGPGATYWQYDHVSVNGNELEIRASRNPSFSKMNAAGINAGCITSNSRVVYPVFVETSVSLANISLASDVWLLSPDDTQEIDIIEAYGGVNYFEKFIHLSHHSFIRQPFTDYQPRDHNSWFARSDVNSWGDYTWDNGNIKYVQVGVNWISPKHFEYYIDGELVRVLYHNAFATKKLDGSWEYTQPYLNASGGVAFNGGYQSVKTYSTSKDYSLNTLKAASNSNNVSAIDPLGFQGGRGFTKPMDIIINIESQSWLVENNSPSDADLADPDKNTMRVDWIRVYKPQ